MEEMKKQRLKEESKIFAKQLEEFINLNFEENKSDLKPSLIDLIIKAKNSLKDYEEEGPEFLIKLKKFAAIINNLEPKGEK